MWFSKTKKEGGSNERRGASAKVNARRDQAPGNQPLPKVVWIPIVGILAIAVGALLTWKIGALMFWENPDYAIKKMEIHVDGPTITASHVKEYMNVCEGSNLFSSNLQVMRTNFLFRTPVAKSITLHRRLPDTLIVDVVERIPLARLGRWGTLAVDREGRVFSLRAGSREYPVISGCTPENLKLGVQVDQSVMNAIEVVDACNRTKVGERVKIASLDVSPKQWIDLYLTAGERIKLGWPDMDSRVPDIRQRVERKLSALAGALRASEERGRRLVNLDLTFTDQYVPGQEY